MRRAQWFASLIDICSRWLRDQRGNVVVPLTIAMPAVLMLVGVSVDFARTQQAQTKLQHAVDMATLALAKFNVSYDDNEAAARGFIAANLTSDDVDVDTLTLDVDVKKTLNSKTAKISASVKSPLYFAQLLEIDDFTLGAYSEAQEVYQHMEISLVLDTSGSMNSSSKIGQLRDAATEFAEIMLKSDVDADFTTINIIPFGGEVTVGHQNFVKYIEAGQKDHWNGCIDLADMALSGQMLSVGAHDASPDYLCLNSERTATFRQNDLETLKTYISKLNADGWTAADVGAHWGLVGLNPDWKIALPGPVTGVPRAYDDDVAKIMVVMTDGAVNGPWRIDNWGNWYEPYGSTFAKERFRSLCTTAKGLGVEVFTIGFQVSDGWMLDLLKECASNKQNYFEPANGELTDVFKSIAFRLAPLRLVQ